MKLVFTCQHDIRFWIFNKLVDLNHTHIDSHRNISSRCISVSQLNKLGNQFNCIAAEANPGMLRRRWPVADATSTTAASSKLQRPHNIRSSNNSESTSYQFHLSYSLCNISNYRQKTSQTDPIKSVMFRLARYKQNKIASQRSIAMRMCGRCKMQGMRGEEGLAGQQYAERAMTSVGRWVEVAFRPL